MLDPQQIVEEIKHLLYAVGNPLPDEVASLAGDYMELCGTANDRLRACAGLLKRGLRSEAIQLANQQPNLVDLVATLDFSERPQWCEYLRRAGEMLPPDLRLDEAAELNDAYALEQPLVSLLQQHRSLALARAPLADRIATLRKIAQVDSLNGVWQDDLLTFEAARHRQIEAEAQAAAVAGDVAALACLESEVCASAWRMPPPHLLRTLVQTKHSRVRQDSSRTELRRLASELSTAHGAFDTARARALRGRWQACAELTDLVPSDPLAELAAPALEWLAEEDRRDEVRAQFQADVFDLEQKLDAGASREKLERAYYRAARHDIELPPTTQIRFREQIAALDVAGSRRTKIILVAIVGGLIVLGASTTVAVRYKMFNNAVAEAAGRLKGLLDEQKLYEAHEYLIDLSNTKPEVAKSGAVRELVARHEGLMADEKARRAGFDHALEAATATANFKLATLQSLANADEKLKSQVSALAQRLDEQAQIEELRERIVTKRIDVQRRIDADFERRLGELIERSQQIETGDFAPADSYADALADLAKQLATLGNQSGLVTSALAANRTDLANRVQALGKAVAAEHERRQWQEMVTGSIGHAVRFSTMLGEYAKKFPDTVRARQFQQVAQEESLWDGLQRWDEAASRLNPKNTAQFLEAAKKFAADPLISKFPMLEQIRERLPYFEAAAKRPERGLPEAIKTLLENPLITGLYTIDVRREGKVERYYVRKGPTAVPFHFHYVMDFQLQEQHFEFSPGKHMLSAEQIVLRDGELSAKSPQWLLADKLRDTIHGWAPDGWEAAFYLALQQIAADRELDPILKILLLKTFSEAGKEGSLVFDEALRPVLGPLNGGGLDSNANWLLPNDAAAIQQRDIARGIAGRLTFAAEPQKKMNEKLAWLTGLSFARHAWVGWLAKEEGDGKQPAVWRCLTPRPVRESGDLVVIFRPAGDGPTRLETIGRVQNQESTVTIDRGDALVEGRPVFLMLGDGK